MTTVAPAAVAAAAHLALSLLLLLWTVAIAGRIARRRDAPRALVLLSGLGGLLVIPAVFVSVVTGSVITGRALFAVSWIWPATAALLTAQAVYATARGLLPRPFGALVVAYNAMVLAESIVRVLLLFGVPLTDGALVVTAAHAGALEIAASATATMHPLFLFPPVLAPAVPIAKRRFGFLLRGTVILVLVGWSTLLLLSFAPATHAVWSYRTFARERIQEHPDGDFAIGVKLFPDVTELGPPDIAVERDVALAREMEATALAVTFAPGALTDASLALVARAIDEPRRAGALLVVTLAVSDEATPARPRDAAWQAARVREVEMLVRLLRPEYFVPGRPAAWAAQRVPATEWQAWLATAAEASRRTRPRTRVLAPLAGFTPRDSVMHAWATAPSAPVDGVGFRMTASPRGGVGLEARQLAAVRWMRAAGSPREHWVLEATGWPMVFGERNHERGLWGTLAWASRQPEMRGVIVVAASDYGAPIGLRAVSGRVRPAARRMGAAIRALEEAEERAGAAAPAGVTP